MDNKKVASTSASVATPPGKPMVETSTTPVVPVTPAQLQAKLQEAAKKGDWKAVRQFAKELDAVEAGAIRAAAEAKTKALAELTEKVREVITAQVKVLMAAGRLDAADGIWYAYDFGDKSSSCRLTKSAPRAPRGSGTGTGSYISRPEKTADLLAQVGSHIMFKGDTSVTIDKVAQVVKAGTTFKQAFDLSTNGGWRNRCRMAILREAGII